MPVICIVMEALSIRSPKNDSFYNLEFAPYIHSFPRNKHKKACLARGFRVSVHLRNTNGSFGFVFFSRYSTLRYCAFLEPKRHSIGSSAPLALAFEGQAVLQDSDLAGDLSGESVSEGLNGVHSESVVQHNDLPLRYSENDVADEQKLKDEGREKGKKVLSEKKSNWVDTRALAWRLRAAKSVNDVEVVLKDMGDLPLMVYSSVLKGLGKEKRVDSAVALVEWLKQKKQRREASRGPNLFIYNTLLGVLKQAEQFEQVEKIMSDMSAEGITPNIVTYNILMGICVAQGREMEALNLFDELQTKGLSPSAASYSTALLAYRRMEDAYGALQFYANFRNKYENGKIGNNGNKEDWENEAAKLQDFAVRICYQVMRGWLVRNENLSSKVLALLTSIDQVGLHTGRSEHERLIWACTRVEHYVVAKELYKRIRERDSEISLSVCNHVIWLLGKAKKWWAALEIYEDLLDKGPKPNNLSYELIVSHFDLLLTAARKKGIWRWGVGLLNKMEEKGLKPGSKQWNSVLIACSRASEASTAVQIFKRMVDNGEKPTIISYSAVLSALEKGKLYDEALRVWNHMIKMGVEQNAYVYTIMASIYAGQGRFDMVESVIQEMLVSKVELTVVTFNAIITVCVHNNMVGRAFEWFQRMEVEKIEPNEATYETLVEGLGKDGKPKLAYDLYLRSRHEGLNLSSKAYDAVIESSQAYGATIDLSLLGPRPPEKKLKVHIRNNYGE